MSSFSVFLILRIKQYQSQAFRHVPGINTDLPLSLVILLNHRPISLHLQGRSGLFWQENLYNQSRLLFCICDLAYKL
ncbi:hypothetical protein CS542_10735 [Pedobacter sp. IW39]|nr:hypothetical protein CS542_10735 [Pedobacter sp. IW39]